MRDEDVPLYAALAARSRAARLGRVVDELLPLARPAISLGLTRVDEGAIPIGASKVGGAADLPPGAMWPEGQGEPLPFIAQVRLEEVAHLDPEGDLPHQGLLSFFYTTDDPAGGLRVEDNPAAWRVRYTADATALERRPILAALVGKRDSTFPACTVTPRRRLTLPPGPNEVAAALGCTNDERLALIGIVGGDVNSDFADEMDHRLLGYPYTLNDPHPFLEGYLARSGLTRPVPPEEYEQAQQQRQRALQALQTTADAIRGARGLGDLWRAVRHMRTHDGGARLGAMLAAVSNPPPQPPPAFQARMAELQRTADDEWRLLLQVYSNEEAEMDWAGGGVIHFSIARADLAARDFSCVWANLDFL